MLFTWSSSMYWMNSLFAKNYIRNIFFHCLQYYYWKKIFQKKIISEKYFFIACRTTAEKTFFWKRLFQKNLFSLLAVLLLQKLFSEKDFFRKMLFHCLQHYWTLLNSFCAYKHFCMLLLTSALFCMLLHSSVCFRKIYQLKKSIKKFISI